MAGVAHGAESSMQACVEQQRTSRPSSSSNAGPFLDSMSMVLPCTQPLVDQQRTRTSSSIDTVPPRVCVCESWVQDDMRRVLGESLGEARRPEYIVLNGPGEPELFDECGLDLLGPDRGASHGVARRIPLNDGSSLLLKPTFAGRVHPRTVQAMAATYTQQGHSLWYRKHQPRKARKQSSDALLTPC